MRARHRVAAVIAVLAIACATVGPKDDQLVVRAEDVLSNSLQTYKVAMEYHFANSTRESPQVYKAFEYFRVYFPLAWNTLNSAKLQYQADKSRGSTDLVKALDAVAILLSNITPLLVNKAA